MNATTPSKQPARRKLQFTLRGALVLITVLGVWLGLQVNSANRQRQSLAAFEQPDRWLYSYQFPGDGGGYPDRSPLLPQWLVDAVGVDFFYSVTSVNLNGASMQADRLESLRNLKRLKYLGLDNAEITESVMKSIAQMHELDYLSLQMCDVTDEQLALLRNSVSLTSLYLTFDKITDDGLESLSDLKRLESLQLQGDPIEGPGLKHLVPLSQLNDLTVLGKAATSAEGIEHLSKMPQLQFLRLTGRQIDEEGFKKLQNALPNTKITR
jgi:hypothetical protein